MNTTTAYFPLEVNLFNDHHVSMLIEKHGPKGYGAYMMILTGLRNCEDYEGTLFTIEGIARRCKISPKMLHCVLYDFGLFEITHTDRFVLISSPYLNRVMGAYEEKRRILIENGKKGFSKVSRNADGQFTAAGGALDKIRLDKKKKTTTTVVAKKDPDDDDDVDVAVDVAVVESENENETAKSKTTPVMAKAANGKGKETPLTNEQSYSGKPIPHDAPPRLPYEAAASGNDCNACPEKVSFRAGDDFSWSESGFQWSGLPVTLQSGNSGS